MVKSLVTMKSIFDQREDWVKACLFLHPSWYHFSRGILYLFYCLFFLET